MDITVCIATHKRAEGLRKLLDSLASQSGAPPFDVVVVDNDAAQSAESIVAAYRDRFRVTYLTEPVRGLARVRNRAVGATTSSFLAFVDDDEWVTPEWLASLSSMARDTSADAVMGPVRLVFDDDVEPYIRACRLFDEATYPDGEIVPWYAARTSNALVRRASLPDVAAPFAERFDLTGGEDTDLFRRMVDAGASIRAANRALVFEYRAASRANLGWVVRRAARNGGTIADIEWRGFPAVQRFWRGVKAGVGAIRPAVRAGLNWRHDRARSVDSLIDAAEGIGKLAHAFGIRIQEYRTHP